MSEGPIRDGGNAPDHQLSRSIASEDNEPSLITSASERWMSDALACLVELDGKPGQAKVLGLDALGLHERRGGQRNVVVGRIIAAREVAQATMC